MIFLLKHTARVGSLLFFSILACSSALAQNSERPDLEGIWTNASLTSLSRRSGVETLVVSAEEARILADSVPVGGLEGGFDEGDGVNNTPDASEMTSAPGHTIISGSIPDPIWLWSKASTVLLT